MWPFIGAFLLPLSYPLLILIADPSRVETGVEEVRLEERKILTCLICFVLSRPGRYLTLTFFFYLDVFVDSVRIQLQILGGPLHVLAGRSPLSTWIFEDPFHRDSFLQGSHCSLEVIT